MNALLLIFQHPHKVKRLRLSWKCKPKPYTIPPLMNDNITLVLNGFFALKNLDKLQVVEAINEYFDSNDRDPIRAKANERFSQIDTAAPNFKCPCCER